MEQREKFTVFSEFWCKQAQGFWFGVFGRADQWNKPSLGDTFMPVMDADL